MSPEVYRYLSSIRNVKKRDYGRKYYEFLCGLRTKEPTYYGKSPMAAQAVRMRLAELRPALLDYHLLGTDGG